LDDELELVHPALLEVAEQLLEGAAAARPRHVGAALARRALLGDLPGHPVVADHDEVVARARHRRQAHHQDGTRRGGLLHRLAGVVEHRPDAAEGLAADDRVAHAERAALDQDRRHRAAPLVAVGVDRDALRVHRRVGPQVELGVGGQQDRFEQVVDALALERGDVDEQRRTAVLLGHQAVLGELAPDLGRVGALLVDLVDRDDDRHVGRLGVAERLDRLRLHAFVGRDHQHRDVRGLRASGTRGGERLVTRGDEEGDLSVFAFVLGLDLVGTDVLGDATGLARGDVGLADRVEQLGLTVVDVAHDGHHRRPRGQVGVVALVLAELDVEGLEKLAVLLLGADDLDVVVPLGAEQLQRLLVDRLRGRHHLAEVQHDLHQRGGVGPDPVGEVGQRRTARQADRRAVAAGDLHTADRRRRHVVELLAPLTLGLAATRGTATGTPEGTRRAAAATATTAGTAAEATGTAARTRAAATGTAGEAAGTPAATAGTATAARTAAAATTGTAGTSARRRGTALRH